jgi:hypothetical protein
MAMRIIYSILLFSFSLFCTALPSEEPTLSKEPLTNEEIAIYREVLQHIQEMEEAKLDHQINLADRTEPIDQAAVFNDQCLRGNPMEVKGKFVPAEGPIITFPKPGKNALLIIHKFDASVLSNLKAVLVDLDRQRKKVDAIKVPDRTPEDFTGPNCQAGLFTLSEILFDEGRQYAAVHYSVYCGKRVGYGATEILKKDGGKWKIFRACNVWGKGHFL